jgi:hypothetical protein
MISLSLIPPWPVTELYGYRTSLASAHDPERFVGVGMAHAPSISGRTHSMQFALLAHGATPTHNTVENPNGTLVLVGAVPVGWVRRRECRSRRTPMISAG